MKHRVFSNSFFLCVLFAFFGLAHPPKDSWKSAGEFFEAEYLSALYGIRQSETREDARALDYLQAAIGIYLSQAEAGDADAQFRLGMYLEKGKKDLASAEFWYEKAAANGHAYAADRLAGRKINAANRCETFADMLLTPIYSKADALYHVESLALLGQGQCMRALGEWYQRGAAANPARAIYWQYRAILTASTTGLSGKPFADLAATLESYLGDNHKRVVTLYEKAAREGDRYAPHWLENHAKVNGRLANAHFLNDKGLHEVAQYVFKGIALNGQDASENFDLWTERDKDIHTDSRATLERFSSDLGRVLDSLTASPNELTKHALQALSLQLSGAGPLWQPINALVDVALSLYRINGAQNSDDAHEKIVNFLMRSLSGSVPLSTRLLLLERVLDAASVEQRDVIVQKYDVLNKVASEISILWPSARLEFFEGLQAALMLRPLLGANHNMSSFDAAIAENLARFWRDAAAQKESRLSALGYFFDVSADELEYAVLTDAIRLAKHSGRADLLLLILNQALSSELMHVEFMMQLDDLLVGLSPGAQGFKQTQAALSALMDFYEVPGGSAKAGNSLNEFPKIKILKESGISLSAMSFDETNPLTFAHVYRLDALAKAQRRYQETGSYVESKALAATLSPVHMDLLKGRFANKLQTLTDATAEYRRSREDRNVLQDAHFAQSVSEGSVRSHLEMRTQELKAQISELLATQHALDERVHVAGYLGQAKEQLRTSEGLSVFKHFAGDSEQFSVYPSDAKMWSMEDSDGAPMFAHKAIKLKKNEILNVRATGEWSPICALRRSGLLPWTEKPSVGPEGFRLATSTGQSTARGNDERHTTSRFKQESSTLSSGFDLMKMIGPAVGAIAGAVIGAPVGALVGMQVGATATSGLSLGNSWQKTEGKSESHDKSAYNQNSTFDSHVASFQSGLRLQNTPYQTAPAGAYLAIMVSNEVGRTGKILSMNILSGQTTLVAPEESTVYLVVNDCQDGEQKEGMLAVYTQILKPASTEMERLIESMERELRKFSERGSILVREGGDLSSRIETLKADAIAELQRESTLDFMSEPTLRSAFLQWLAHEGDVIVRKARIVDLTRAMYLNSVEISSLENQLKQYAQHEDVLSNRLNQVVRSLQAVPLFDAVADVTHHATRYLLPMLKLYRPKETITFGGVKPQPSDSAGVAQFVARLSEQILRGLDSEVKLPTEQYVVVRIPRPGIRLDARERELMPTLDDDRARIFWNHVFGNSKEEFGLRLEFKDLYAKNVRGGLFLGQEAPIVLDMALLFGLNDATAVEYLESQTSNFLLELTVGREQVFPKEEGPKDLMIINDALCVYSIRAGFVDSLNVLNDAVAHVRDQVTMNLNTAKGLSLFSAFGISEASKEMLPGFNNLIGIDQDGFPKNMDSIFVVMKIISTHQNQPMSWMLQ